MTGFVRVALAVLRGAYCRIEGRESPAAPGRAARGRPSANCPGLASVSGGNPGQFGHQRSRGAAGAPTTAHSLPSMMQLNAAQRPKRIADDDPYDPNCHSSSTGRDASRPPARTYAACAAALSASARTHMS
jgi:hypothetical protein